ncbi:serine hydrolase [Streptomyces sp. NBC_01353]|uniref:serine hydrolase n=1 Tax=Streptomyces sp. NBC_01353 TaxID=2903835 RepID=UPI002E3817F8|nr:serine hydrolase [Streptomyces sp. NBC_01353]
MPRPRLALPAVVLAAAALCAPAVRPADPALTASRPTMEETATVTVEVDLDAVLTEAVGPVVATSDASLSVAVLDLETGRSASYGGAGRTYDTASVVKLDILVALLLRAQDEGREPTAAERTAAAAMIRRSDNTSATTLWQTIGGAEGLGAANARLGLSETTGAAAWGLTQTTAADQLALLTAVFGTDSPLDPDSRAYATELMEGVVAGQDWGVSAAGDGPALKNGWLPRDATGLWDINSVGRVTAGGRVYLVAVVSDGHATKEAGIGLVEDAARAAVSAVGAVL